MKRAKRNIRHTHTYVIPFAATTATAIAEATATLKLNLCLDNDSRESTSMRLRRVVYESSFKNPCMHDACHPPKTPHLPYNTHKLVHTYALFLQIK